MSETDRGAVASAASGWADNHGVALRWERFGPETGMPLLCICGLGSPMVAFETGFVAELLSQGFQVARFDNRDVGQSDRVESGYELADLAADAVAVLDALGWSATNLLGQSMGGMIAQQLSISDPARVRSLTSLMSATGARGVARASDEVVAALLEVPPADREGWLEHRVRTEAVWGSPAASQEWVRAKGELLFDYGIDPQGSARQYRALSGAESRDEALANIGLPTLVLHGEADTLIPPAAGRHTAGVVPGARYVEIAGMGHDLPPAHWREIAEAVAAVAR